MTKLESLNVHYSIVELLQNHRIEHCESLYACIQSVPAALEKALKDGNVSITLKELENKCLEALGEEKVTLLNSLCSEKIDDEESLEDSIDLGLRQADAGLVIPGALVIKNMKSRRGSRRKLQQ